MTTYLTIQPDPSIALDLSVDGNDVEVTTREADAYGVVVRLPLPVLRAALDGLEAEEESDGSYTRTEEDTWDFTSGAGSVFPSPAKGLRYQRERDEARNMAALWKDTARRAVRHTAGWRSAANIGVHATDEVSADRDRQRARAEKAEENVRAREEMINRLALRAEQPRPLTADDITDEMVERALASFEKDRPGIHHFPWMIRNALTAALIEPTRPEWEDAPAVIAVCNDSMTPRVFSRGDGGMWHSDHYSAHTHQLRDVTPLYPGGVRATGAES